MCSSVLDTIGNTPLIRIRCLSEATGCEVRPPAQLAWTRCDTLADRTLPQQILGKAEFLNPGGSVKDRVALQIVREALADGRLKPGGLVTEGTVGSTGISLAMVRMGSAPDSCELGVGKEGCGWYPVAV